MDVDLLKDIAVDIILLFDIVLLVGAISGHFQKGDLCRVVQKNMPRMQQTKRALPKESNMAKHTNLLICYVLAMLVVFPTCMLGVRRRFEMSLSHAALSCLNKSKCWCQKNAF